MFKRKWRLDRCLILIISLTVIPINILAIGFSQMVRREAQNQILESVRSEYQVFMSDELTLTETFDQWYTEQIRENMQAVTNARAFSEIAGIGMVKDAAEAMDLYQIHGIFLMKEKKGDERIYARGRTGDYSVSELEGIKNDFEADLSEKEAGLQQWKLTDLDGHIYLLSLYDYANYTIGYGIELPRQVENWMETETLAGGLLLISDRENTLVLSDEGVQLADGTVAENTATVLADGRWTRIGEKENDTAYTELYMPSEKLQTGVRYGFLSVLAWGSALLLVMLWFFIRRQVVKPLESLKTAMRNLEKENLLYRIEEEGKTEDFHYIYDEFNRMADEILQSQQQKKELYETRMNNIRLQVNPHILLNSLTTIYSLAETGDDHTIQRFTMNLVEYFRYSLRENTELATVSAEMKFTESYMEIQKIRYPGEMTFTWMIEEDCENALIPALLIQNIVENASKYARVRGSVIEIVVCVRRQEDRLCISVDDTGAGIEADILERLNSGQMIVDAMEQKHIGIWNCRKRMEVLCGEGTRMHFTSLPGEGTQVWIELPYRLKGGYDETADRG